MKRSILLIEDELIIAENTRNMILDVLPDSSVYIVSSEQECIEMLSEVTPDLALVDIRLGEHGSGLDLSLQLQKREIPFIFLTAHGDADTIKKAVRTKPEGYLIKPVHKNDLLATLSLCFSRLTGERYYIFKEGSHDVRIPEKDIIYLRSDNIYTELHTPEKRYVIRQSTRNILDELVLDLMQVHRSYFVNPDFVRETNAKIFLTTGEELPLSRTYRSGVMSRLFDRNKSL